MTDRADVTRLQTLTGNVVTLARRDLTAFWSTLDLTRPEAARDALLAYLPSLVSTYGDVATTIAADWYETTRARQVVGPFTATTIQVDTAAASGTVRYAAGHLFTDAPDAALPVMLGATQRYLAGVSRATVGMNVRRDPAKPRWGRIPTGEKTCAWCTLLASRGFVYHSEHLAGGDGRDFHDDCDCQIVADWSKDPVIDGYHPGKLYDLYRQARDSPDGGNDDRSIAAAMRRLHPHLYSDGVTAG